MADREMLKMEFPELRATLHAAINRDLNPELWDAFAESLPFEGIAGHSAVSGPLITCWAPPYAIVPIKTMERIDKMPVGRVMMSGSANKIFFKYGPLTEWVDVPIVGQVEGEDLASLQRLGPVIWESIFLTKHLYHIKLSRA